LWLERKAARLAVSEGPHSSACGRSSGNMYPEVFFGYQKCMIEAEEDLYLHFSWSVAYERAPDLAGASQAPG
jgi:hypothetical protein